MAGEIKVTELSDEVLSAKYTKVQRKKTEALDLPLSHLKTLNDVLRHVKKYSAVLKVELPSGQSGVVIPPKLYERIVETFKLYQNPEHLQEQLLRLRELSAEEFIGQKDVDRLYNL